MFCLLCAACAAIDHVVGQNYWQLSMCSPPPPPPPQAACARIKWKNIQEELINRQMFIQIRVRRAL